MQPRLQGPKPPPASSTPTRRKQSPLLHKQGVWAGPLPGARLGVRRAHHQGQTNESTAFPAGPRDWPRAAHRTQVTLLTAGPGLARGSGKGGVPAARVAPGVECELRLPAAVLPPRGRCPSNPPASLERRSFEYLVSVMF